MIPFEEALKISLDSARLITVEKVGYLKSIHRVLAEDLYSDISMPPFDKSAMDGYACRQEDLDTELEVIEVIPAGIEPQKTVGHGQCSQIMTGAIIPKGADTVIMVEDIEKTGPATIRYRGKGSKSNICYLGEDLKTGDLVLRKGTLITSRHIPVLASIGIVDVPVYKSLKVGVIATGTELVEPDQYPGISQIRNSNASQMIAQLAGIGIQAKYFGIAPDNEDTTFSILRDAAKESDLLILSGGVSMGEFDFVPSVLVKLGFDIKYQKIAVQPGKPTTFGVSKDKYVFALPGNPVSSFVQFEILVKPFIYKCMGHEWTPPGWRLPAGKLFTRKRDDRMSWIPIKISDDGKVMPLEYHGSAHIFALNQAQGLIYFEIGQKQIEVGELLNVRPI